MNNKHPQKKKPEEINRSPLKEMEISDEDFEEFEHGIELFNSGKFWHAHEAWEEVWRRHHEDERLFLQGIIQLAAAYHLLVTAGSFKGMLGNFEKARLKLVVFEPMYLGVNVTPLLHAIERSVHDAKYLGASGMTDFDRTLIPKIHYHKPATPDLSVEIKILISDAEFQEGVRLFNTGYQWDAHERWDDVARAHHGEARLLAQAFSQMALAYSFLKLGKSETARYPFEKALATMERYQFILENQSLNSIVAHMEEILGRLPTMQVLAGVKSAPIAKIPQLFFREVKG